MQSFGSFSPFASLYWVGRFSGMHTAGRDGQYIPSEAEVQEPTTNNLPNCLLIRRTRHPNNFDRCLLEKVVTGGY